jgi:hypothetical protein
LPSRNATTLTAVRAQIEDLTEKISRTSGCAQRACLLKAIRLHRDHGQKLHDFARAHSELVYDYALSSESKEWIEEQFCRWPASFEEYVLKEIAESVAGFEEAFKRNRSLASHKNLNHIPHKRCIYCWAELVATALIKEIAEGSSARDRLFRQRATGRR